MVAKNFEDEPGLKEQWESESMLGRISTAEEFRGPATFLISNASSYMTGASMVIDGGHTAW
jgi:NAD(P)-dependent dehydrogenase (short-subunit alcohol dehydrogenase family)